MVYGVYKHTRDSAWKCIIDCGVDSLPVNLSKICRHFDIKIVKNSSLGINRLRSNEHAVNIFIDRKCYIIVDDSDTMQTQRFSIAHEIGHIFMGKSAGEPEAEKFAMNLLAPACVLWGLDLHKKQDIAEICDIPEESAKKRAVRMRVLYKREKFLTSDMEKKVFEQFKPYIADHLKTVTKT
ncbi:MAG: ImmA/IrrE family metallo-endopeptidase [Ruminococcus sp.]|nr:ImmA/IrrE family metallo-endopeptidase [Ruminococcus sp.]